MKKPTLEDRLENAGVMFFVGLCRALPLGQALTFASLVGRSAFDVLRFRRDVTLRNLEERLGGELDRQHILDIGRRCYENFSMSVAEFARLPVIDDDYIQKSITAEGLENFDRAQAEGIGAILVTGHYGSWELMGCVLVKMGYPITFAIGVQRNPLVQRLMNELRHGAGIETVEAARVRRIVKTVRSNRFVALLSDQDAGPQGVFVDFMGRAASTPPGPARLSLMTRAPVIPGFITRSGARHHITIGKPIYPDLGIQRQEAVRLLTQEYTRVIESYVKEHPDHWLWGHRRWKTPPPQNPISF